MSTALPLLALGLLAARLAWQRRRRTFRSLFGPIPLLLSVLLLFAGAYAFWYYHRSLPAGVTDQPLFRGVSYSREVRRLPRPMIIHVVRVRLKTPGVRFFVTPEEPAEGHHLRARTTSQFLSEFKMQLAINAAFFHPWHAGGPLRDYYPHVGDPTSVMGPAVSEGRSYSSPRKGFRTLCLGKNNRADIVEQVPLWTFNAVSGTEMLVTNGRRGADLEAEETRREPHPRTAVALDAAKEQLLLVVIDGRQPNYSAGATLTELAEIIMEQGGHDALNLDGGGSSTLVIEGTDGLPEILNSPVHRRIPPGRERPVANHLGVRAEYLEPTTE